MTRLIVLLFLLNLMQSCVVKENYFCNKYYTKNVNLTDWARYTDPGKLFNLKGNIKEITHLSYSPNQDTIGSFNSDFSSRSYKLIFDNKGNIISESIFFKNGKISNETIFESCYHGRIKELTWFNENGQTIKKQINKYTDDFVPITEIIINNDTTIVYDFLVRKVNDTTYTKNRWFDIVYYKGNLLLKNTFNKYAKWVYEYHENGQRKYDCNFDNNLPQIEEKYNISGQLIEQTFFMYDSTGQVSELHKNSYSYENGLKIKKEELFLFDNKEFISEIDYIYDINNKLLKTFKTEDNIKEEIGYVKYNEFGDIIEELVSKDKILFKNYKYDSYNNWISREEWRNNKVIFRYVRNIEYN